MPGLAPPCGGDQGQGRQGRGADRGLVGPAQDRQGRASWPWLTLQASTSDPIPKREVAKPDGGFYDKTGKSVVNAQSYGFGALLTCRGADGNFGDLAERVGRVCSCVQAVCVADAHMQISAKYDKALEAVVKKWIEV